MGRVIACSSSCAAYVAIGLGIGAVMAVVLVGCGFVIGGFLALRSLEPDTPHHTTGDS
jgi:hypothetical protein